METFHPGGASPRSSLELTPFGVLVWLVAAMGLALVVAGATMRAERVRCAARSTVGVWVRV